MMREDAGAQAVADAPATDRPLIESLNRKIRDYDRWFQFLDGQMRVLERERQKLSAVVSHSDAGFFVVDGSLRVIWANQALDGLVSPGDGGPLKWPCSRTLCGEAEICSQCPASTAFRTGRVAHIEIRRDSPAGERQLYATAMPIRSPEGETEEAIVMVQDVSDLDVLRRSRDALRASEEALRHSQKMEAIGTLAGGVAHDFNNILTGILGHSELLLRSSRPGDSAHRSAGVIFRAAQRASALTQQLLGFARRGKNQSVPVDLHTAVSEVLELLSRTIDKSITIETDLRAHRAMVSGDPGQIGQVILNLSVNARDAMESGGALRVSTSIVEVSERDCAAHPGAVPGAHLRLAVADSGCGIPAEIRDRIFEPFFTTKPCDRGTGMGLAMVYGIVRNHGGWITIESEPGRGTEVAVTLPLGSGQPAERLPAPPESVPRGTGRILFVDDEPMIRELASELLAGLGYETITACDGQEALEIFRESHGSIDLVVMDLVMPNMGGRDCFRMLRAIDPGLKAILSSGHGMNNAAQELLDDGLLGFLRKPFDLRELALAVESAISSPSGEDR